MLQNAPHIQSKVSQAVSAYASGATPHAEHSSAVAPLTLVPLFVTLGTLYDIRHIGLQNRQVSLNLHQDLEHLRLNIIGHEKNIS